MTKRMLIDATHAEETRVVVLDGNRLEDFDVETSTKRQLKGNIYLAKVVRVEPSLQAAFVEYGGGRHGFLAFAEIHPDYYQIPVADRQRLIEMQAEEARREQEEDDRIAAQDQGRDHTGDHAGDYPVNDTSEAEATPVPAGADDGRSFETASPAADLGRDITAEGRAEAENDAEIGVPRPQAADIIVDVLRGPEDQAEAEPAASAPVEADPSGEIGQTTPAAEFYSDPDTSSVVAAVASAEEFYPEAVPEAPPPEFLGGDHDGAEDPRDRRPSARFSRNYKIQEVIKRRQILLVQVVKEERGTKGAALTTYISLAGRYCVLMPNSPRGGGISRKITSLADRRRLKEATAELDLPKGMGLIVRTAGANRPKPEIKRDCEYLLRLWDDIREHTMRSVAPALIYEEASLIKRAIRDVYSRDVDELIVDGEPGWRAARDFMRMLMPTHAKKVQLWSEPQPLFARFQVDSQLDAMMLPNVQLRSGGYLVINQTEALVAIDVNSGRSTRERGIEETALRTNLEAADEVARQLRLRDLAGLVVVDFIDMESKRNNGAVEKRMKDALKVDRARIQLGHISHFGLLEMSRQRMRPSLAETNFIACPHCGGLGHVRGTESSAIHVLRGIEEEAAKRRAAEVMVHVALPIAMYILNHKRDRLGEIEQRYGLHVGFCGDETLIAPQFRIDRVRAPASAEPSFAVRPETSQTPRAEIEPGDEDIEAEPIEAIDAVPSAVETLEPGPAEAVPASERTEETAEDEQRRKRRRRRRRGGRGQDSGLEPGATEVEEASEAPAGAAQDHVEGVPEHQEATQAGEEERSDDARRRRGRRGRGRPRRSDDLLPDVAAPGAEQPDLAPVYAGPTPADPFGGQAFDIFDVIERAEQHREDTPAPLPPPASSYDVGPASEQPEPAAERDGAAPTDTGPEPLPSPPAPANDVVQPEPLIAPILVGSEADAPAERKRGWWRR